MRRKKEVEGEGENGRGRIREDKEGQKRRMKEVRR